jgi:glycosyltransferase involved in cell wall biosynthesis
MTSILLFGAGIPPIDPAMPVSGDGLRIWQLYQGLKSKNFDVHLSLYQGIYNNFKQYIPENIGKFSFGLNNQDELIKKIEPDIIIFQHWPSNQINNQSIIDDIPVVMDFHGPHILERHFQNFETLSSNKSQKIKGIRQCDFFTCAGEYQKSYFIGFLIASGLTDVITEKRIAAVPFSLDPNLPDIRYEMKRKTPLKIIYSGMFLPWQDPFPALTTVINRFRERHYDAELNIFGGQHPVYPISTEKFDEFIIMTKDNPYIHYKGLVSRKDLLQEFEQTHIALDLMSWNLERELAFTSRTLEFLWAGIPVIYNNYSELSEYIQKYNAGWCVDPSHLDNLINIIDDVQQNRYNIIEYAENAQKLVRSNFTWDITIDALERFCRNPSKRDYTQDVPLMTENQIKNDILNRSLRCIQENGLLYTLHKGFDLVLGGQNKK